MKKQMKKQMKNKTATTNKAEKGMVIKMSTIMSGKEVSAHKRMAIAEECKKYTEEHGGKKPGLAVIIVGNDPASAVYVRNKAKACEEVGFASWVYEMKEETTQEELDALIVRLNADPLVHGILCQLPLPKHLDEKHVIELIDKNKDVDAFHPYNVGKIMEGDYRFLPCTPAGVMEILHYYGIEISGKNCVVVGRSNIVGKPMSMLLLHENGTVKICHSRTKDLAGACAEADILVCAIGKPKFFGAEYVKEGAVVIDVGINRDENGKLCGDVDFDAVKDKASYITPVPGGVGPMTITMLLENTLRAAKG